tara:strand:+ start:4618 stop:4881 length:264 start_codon:yes stop_codon:yes gene_type:complete
MKDIVNIQSVADMEIWVQAHGYPRFCEAIANGEFRGQTLRVAREWDIDRSERRKRRLGMALATLLILVFLAFAVIYGAPVLFTSAGH